jgi:hypothetical protein
VLGTWSVVAEVDAMGSPRVLDARWSPGGRVTGRKTAQRLGDPRWLCASLDQPQRAGANVDCRPALRQVHVPPRNDRELPAHAEVPTSVVRLRFRGPAVDAVTGRTPSLRLQFGTRELRWTPPPPPAKRAASAGDLQVLHANGSPDQSLDVVIVGDGFTADGEYAFLVAAKACAEGWLNFPPYQHSMNLVNSYALFVPSAQSGADHPSKGKWVDTAFDTTFEYAGVERLAVANTSKVMATVNQAFPQADLVVVLVNDPQYGGSGGSVPVVSLHVQSIDVLRHELAHTIADLADEYTAPYPGYPDDDHEPNVSHYSNLFPPKWQAWVTPGTLIPTPASAIESPTTPIGAYEGAKYKSAGVYRSTPNCFMRELGADFCPVCAEAIVLAVAAETDMLREWTPVQSTINCVLPNCPVLQVLVADLPQAVVEWWRGDTLLGKGTSWQPGPNDVGSGTVHAWVRDATPLVRHDPEVLQVETHSWLVTVQAAEPVPDAGTQPDVDADAAIEATADSDPNASEGFTSDGALAQDTGGAQPASPPWKPDGCSTRPAAPGSSTWTCVLLAALAIHTVRRNRRNGGRSWT